MHSTLHVAGESIKDKEIQSTSYRNEGNTAHQKGNIRHATHNEVMGQRCEWSKVAGQWSMVSGHALEKVNNCSAVSYSAMYV